MLPDSNVNEVGSHGFLKFKISHVDDIPLGTQINNRVGIYFDANPVVLTNTTLHTVDENFIEVIIDDVETIESLKSTLQVFPNPMSDYAIFKLNTYLSNGKLSLFNTNGMLVQSMRFSGEQFRLEANNLAKGMYFFQIMENGIPLNSGKIIIR